MNSQPATMPANLLSSPRFQADQLGCPMPDDPHAVSACLPLWQHNIGYEEGDPQVHQKLQAAYPRFCFHPIVQQLANRFLNQSGRRGLPFVSPRAAERAAAYVRHAAQADPQIVTIDQGPVCGVTVPADSFGVLKQYWQHAGENVSSRVAELVLANRTVKCSETTARSAVRSRVAEVQSTSPDNVFLFPSGMAAIACAWRTVRAFRSGITCQFGFPYVDTLKIQQRFPGPGYEFLPTGDAADLTKLKELCETQSLAVVFCEIPTNPLLVTPDLLQLRELADAYDFLLVVDDTLGACGNVAVLPYADLAVTSLTKYFSGYGNVLAGSLVINPAGRRANELRRIITADFEETLSDADTEVLDRNSTDLRSRIFAINQNADTLAAFLRQHPAVDSVFYPSPEDPNYAVLRAPSGGYGGLLSLVLKDAADRTPAVFDALEVCKGPNLGTNFTLCCPYTILAHYDELDFVESCGVSRWLLRISAGVEPITELIARFARALKAGGHSG